MPKEELISLNEYCRRYKKAPKTVTEMIARGELKATRKGTRSHWLIRVGGDTVPIKQYDELFEKYIKAKTELESIKRFVAGVET